MSLTILASDFHKTEDHFFEASEIDRNRRDPLLFQLASALSQAGQLLQRERVLEEGLNSSPNHWPCLENLITVSAIVPWPWRGIPPIRGSLSYGELNVCH